MHTTSLTHFADYPTGDRERVWTSGRSAGAARGAESASDGPPAAEMEFWDLVDVIQHIPLVSIAYREMTGDTIGNPARVLGGALYGGPVGLLAGVGQSMLVESTGRDAGDHVVAYLFGAPDGAVTDPPDTVVASRPSSMPPELPESGPNGQEAGAEDNLGALKLDLEAPEGGAQDPMVEPPSPNGGQPPASIRGEAPADGMPQPGLGAPIEADDRLHAALAALASGSAPGADHVSSAASPSLLAAGQPGSGLLRSQALDRYRQTAGLAPN